MLNLIQDWPRQIILLSVSLSTASSASAICKSSLTTSINLLLGLPVCRLPGGFITGILQPLFHMPLLCTFPNYLDLVPLSLCPNLLISWCWSPDHLPENKFQLCDLLHCRFCSNLRYYGSHIIQHGWSHDRLMSFRVTFFSKMSLMLTWAKSCSCLFHTPRKN